jgi:hypothetical protein
MKQINETHLSAELLLRAPVQWPVISLVSRVAEQRFSSLGGSYSEVEV